MSPVRILIIDTVSKIISNLLRYTSYSPNIRLELDEKGGIYRLRTQPHIGGKSLDDYNISVLINSYNITDGGTFRIMYDEPSEITRLDSNQIGFIENSVAKLVTLNGVVIINIDSTSYINSMSLGDEFMYYFIIHKPDIVVLSKCMDIQMSYQSGNVMSYEHDKPSVSIVLQFTKMFYISVKTDFRDKGVIGTVINE